MLRALEVASRCLVGGNFPNGLLLSGYHVGPIAIKVRIEGFFKRVYQFLLLIFDVALVCIAHKIDVFALFAESSFLLRRIEWFLLVEFVKARAVDIGFDLGVEGTFVRENVVPVNSLKECVLPNLLNSVSAQPVLCVTH